MPRSNGPWTVLSTDRPYADEFIDVAVDQVVQPDGERGQYATVRMKPGVTILPIDGEGRVRLVRQFRYALGAESLEAPAGGVDDGEDPLDAARRELEEELGITAETWEPLGTVHIDTSIVHCPDHLFVARDLTFGEPDREGTERMTSVTVTLGEAVERVVRGEIVQASSCVLILLASRTLSPSDA
ncbi:MAG TPA: NUDIX hydrolase [Rubricoccaceae bacterium]|jgi:ADP-ribose pyrophosphatase YjhB (NUDIX family)